jgi:hypothetical protein
MLWITVEPSVNCANDREQDGAHRDEEGRLHNHIHDGILFRNVAIECANKIECHRSQQTKESPFERGRDDIPMGLCLRQLGYLQALKVSSPYTSPSGCRNSERVAFPQAALFPFEGALMMSAPQCVRNATTGPKQIAARNQESSLFTPIPPNRDRPVQALGYVATKGFMVAVADGVGLVEFGLFLVVGIAFAVLIIPALVGVIINPGRFRERPTPPSLATANERKRSGLPKWVLTPHLRKGRPSQSQPSPGSPERSALSLPIACPQMPESFGDLPPRKDKPGGIASPPAGRR